MYSPLGLVIFVAVEGTFVRFTLFQILFIAAAYAKTNVISHACKAELNRNALAIGHHHSAKR